jgi:hypothetical protein
MAAQHPGMRKLFENGQLEKMRSIDRKRAHLWNSFRRMTPANMNRRMASQSNESSSLLCHLHHSLLASEDSAPLHRVMHRTAQDKAPTGCPAVHLRRPSCRACRISHLPNFGARTQPRYVLHMPLSPEGLSL